MGKYKVNQGHVSNSVFSVGDKATATRKEYSQDAGIREAVVELDKLIDLLTAYRDGNPENESVQRAAKKAKKARRELTSQEPNPTLVRRLLGGTYEAVLGVDALVDAVTKAQALLSHLF